MDIEQYINDHLVLRIGYDVPGYIYTDIIVDDPVGLIEAIDSSKYYVSEILWWEKTPKSQLPKLGAGGVTDPRSPDTNFFAETTICQEFDNAAQKQDYLHYMQQIGALYPNIHLCPSFDIVFR